MKKILSLALAAAMAVAALPVAYAAENEADYSAGTQIILNGSATEEWTVTVPAKLSPVAGQNVGKVKAEGTWAANKYLIIRAPESVTLTYGAQSMDVAVVGGQFSLIGNSVDPVSKEVDVAIEEASRLFGTWEGILEYTVAMGDRGDVNQDGLITQEDADLITQATNLEVELTAEQKLMADFTCDGEITGTDASQIARLVKGGPVGIFTPAQSE